jgi:hypothetical protein
MEYIVPRKACTMKYMPPVGATLTHLRSNVSLGSDPEPMMALVMALGL